MEKRFNTDSTHRQKVNQIIQLQADELNLKVQIKR